MTSPFGPLVLIANPRAGRGKVDAALPEVERILREAGLDYRIVRTTHPGHATEAARQALRDGERFLVAVGGDGTVHEVVNGMIADGQPVAATPCSGWWRPVPGATSCGRSACRETRPRRPGTWPGTRSRSSTWAASPAPGRTSPGTSSTSPRPAWAARWWPGRPGLPGRDGFSAGRSTPPRSG